MSQLREYQARDIQAIEASLARCGRTLYTLATGGGKTVVSAAIIERAVERGKRVLCLTHRREILRQTSHKILIDHGLIQAGLNIDLSYPVQVASVQTLWARCMRSDKLSLPAADLIIIDEAHHVRATTWTKILESYPNAQRLGLTATPCRSDGRGLGNFFDEMVMGPEVAELIKLEHLVSTIYYAPVDPDLRGVETRQGDYAINQLAARMNRTDLVGDIISTWHRHGQRRRTIVFAVDVAHSTHIRNEFAASGVRAEHLDGSTPKEERDAILRRLASGETEVVSNCMVLTEGFDSPDVGCIVLARPTKQLGLFRQMAGRGLRPAPGKSNLILIDHSGAVYRHGLLEDPVRWTLDVDKRAENPTQAARQSQQHHSRLVECTQCAAMRKTGDPCGNCGFLPKQRPDGIVFREGELAEVKNGKARSSLVKADIDRWYAELIFISRDKGYKDGWAAYKFKEKFGEFPPRTIPMPRKPSPEVLSWVRSRQIAFAKAKAKEREAAA